MNKTTLLAILQQSEYDVPRLKQWVKDHASETQVIEPPEWTPKLKLINLVSSLLFFLPSVTAIAVATWVTFPLEQVIRWYYYFSATSKLLRAKKQGLVVVAIAGSYAKTSTKHILAHALGGSHQVLMTPKSINTLLGIAHVILQDLKPEHTLFVVELGEYHRHDIAKLCRFVKPDFGILTPIGRQHLAILGDFATVVTELSDVLAYFNFNPNQTLVADKNQEFFRQTLTYYGTSTKATYQVTSSNITRAGTEAKVKLPPRDTQPDQLDIFCPLYGEHQAVNALTCFWLGDKLGVDRQEIKKRLSTTPYISRRHEPTFGEHDVLVLDNSYNTNADSVAESLKLLRQLNPSASFFITLGFTETGEQAEKLHQNLGKQLATHVDYLGLIKAPWTDAIIEGFLANGGKRSQVAIGTTQEEAFQALQKYIIPGSVIVFEGGFQEVYI